MNNIDKTNTNTYTNILIGECTNCSTILRIDKQEINNEDYIEKDCPVCGWPNQIEVEYDIDDNVIGIHIY